MQAFADLNLSPATLETLAAHEIGDMDTLRAVLADPEALKTLGLPAGPLAKLRAAVGVTSAAPTAVELVEPRTMPLADLLRRVIDRPDDTAALDMARQRALVVAVRGAPCRASIDVSVTCAYLEQMANVAHNLWPVSYQGCAIHSWNEVVPTSRPIFCPLTHEPVIEGRTSISGLTWAVPVERRGFLAFLAQQTYFRRHHTDKAILTDVASGACDTLAEYDVVRSQWTRLSAAERLMFAESLHPGAAGEAGTREMAPDTRVSSLYALVLSCMGVAELRRLLAYSPDLVAVLSLVPAGAVAPAEFVREVLSACERMGLRAEFIDALCRERPRREAEIRGAR